MALRVTALAGGVGGAKMAHGLSGVLPAEDLTVVVNTGDDFDHFGLRICPDLDTVVYTLAGLANRKTGWGREGETWNFLAAAGDLGAPTWFRLGDRDLAMHVTRSDQLRRGRRLSEVMKGICLALGVRATILPMTDDIVHTVVQTDQGDMAFQEYFVQRSCEPAVHGFRFAGVETARPAPGVLEAIERADLVVLCPSNPWVSIDPILAVPGVRPVVAARPTVAISPLVAGRALKGPAAKMAAELGEPTTPQAVARHYAGVIGGLVYDERDPDAGAALGADGIRSLRTQTVMRSDRDRRRLAKEVIAFAETLGPR